MCFSQHSRNAPHRSKQGNRLLSGLSDEDGSKKKNLLFVLKLFIWEEGTQIQYKQSKLFEGTL